MVKRELLSPKINIEDYIRTRIMETIDELLLGIMMVNANATRNAAGKVFMAVKALMSAMVLINLDRILERKSEEERVWYERRGYIVPTKSIKGVSLDLSGLGYREIWTVADKALDLHEYQYNGLDPGFSPYKRREEAMRDMIMVMNIISERLYEWTGKYWDEEIRRAFDEFVKKFDEFRKKHSQ
jgi:hypothetical protein